MNSSIALARELESGGLDRRLADMIAAAIGDRTAGRMTPEWRIVFAGAFAAHLALLGWVAAVTVDHGRHLTAIEMVQTQTNARLTSIERDIKVVKTDIEVMKTDIEVMKTDIVDMRADIVDMRADIKDMKSVQQEILRRLPLAP